MKKIFGTLFVVLFVAGYSFNADALLLTDTTVFTPDGTDLSEDYIDHGWGDVDFLDGIFDYVIWQHQYEFESPAVSINSAVLSLTFWDDEEDKWWNPWTWEVGIGVAESWQWDLGGINDETYRYDINVNYVGDGRFAVGIGSLGGDFGIAKSVLTIDYNAAPVPEPATMLLLGTGLIGLAGVSRRNIFKK